ncbi:hypothetical protein Tco_0066559 [Tanacetum coccineum]
MEYKFKSLFCLGINSIEADKEIGLEKLDEFPELNSIQVNDEIVNKQNCEKDKTDKVHSVSKSFLNIVMPTPISHSNKLEPDNIPLWVKLVNLPLEAWNTKGISSNASCLDWDLPQFFLIVVNAANKELKDRTEICYKDKKNNVTKGTNVQKNNKNVQNVNGLQNIRRDQQGLFGRKVRQA